MPSNMSAELRALFLLSVGVIFTRVSGNTDTAVFEMLIKNYKPAEAPDRYGSRSRYVPVEVEAVLEAMDIQESSSTVQLQLLQRLSWTDVRLRHRSSPAAGGIVVSETTAGYPKSPLIWLPVLLYPRSMQVQFDNSMDNMFKIRPNGTVTWQKRLRLRVPCDLNLQFFPWDQNECRASLRQSLNHDALMLNWTEDSYQPLQTSPHFVLDGFHLTALRAGSQQAVLGDAVGGSVRSKTLTIVVDFSRQAGYYLVNDLIPTSILVLCCYTTFWLPADSVLVRTLICAFMMLASFIVTAIATRAAPLTQYLKALDIWNGVCLLLILWAMLQSIAVYRLGLRSGQKEKVETGEAEQLPPDPPKPPETNGTNSTSGADDPDAASEAFPPPPPTEQLGPLPPRPGRSRRLRAGRRPRPGPACSGPLADTVARALYPVVFLTLVIVFAAVY